MQDRPYDPHPAATESENASPTGEERKRSRLGRIIAHPAVHIPLFLIGMAVLLAVAVLLTEPIARSVSGQADAASQEIGEHHAAPPPADPGDPYTMSSLDIHPDRMFAAFFGGVFSDEETEEDEAGFRDDFRWRLEMFERTYGVDDNFTIRVYDGRTGEMLEVYTLRNLKAIYDATGETDWDDVDFPNRQTHSARLRDKWEARGVPRDEIVVRWGRANQSLESRERDEPFIQYEINLARRLGLSLLATEIGTVETFNQDHLVSSAGARSRYQLMPDNLRLFDVEQYMIPTVSGDFARAREEYHPLLSMEPSMMLVRAYSNAVGHELPGISAYHTGPGNIFRLYQAYLRAHAARPPLNGHVSDAYMWGVTEGFERVRAQSSFGRHSRAYVMKAYGALRATENKLIDPARMARVDRVQLRRGELITLDRILTALGGNSSINWGPDTGGLSLYERFRLLNPHIDLPRDERGGVPRDGNLRFTATADGDPLRFFLPDGAVEVLRRVGYDFFGDVFEFNENTYLVDSNEISRTDRRYERLVQQAGRFGFTAANKRELNQIVGQLDALARRNPTRYRQTQARVARLHQSIWNTRAFRDLMGTAQTLLSIVPNRRAFDRELAIADSLAAAATAEASIEDG